MSELPNLNIEQSPSDPTYSSKKMEETLDYVRKVGPQKPMGYLSFNTIKKCGTTVEELRKELEQCGLKTIFLTEEECAVHDGALYAYDEKALSELLQKNKDILEKVGRPTDAESFIRHLKPSALPKTDIFNIIADAFGDKTNPGRTDVSK